MRKRIQIIVIITFLTLLVVIYLRCFRTRQTMTTVIDRITTYQIPNYIKKRCQKDFGYTDEDIELLATELKKYFIISALTKNQDVGMFSTDVDNLWHTFILFTWDYEQFCKSYIGEFLHHIPEIEEDAKFTPNKFRSFVSAYEKLFNEKPHDIWFLDMCEQKNNPN